MNKRGDEITLPTALKVIIAIASLLILFGLAAKTFGIFTAKTDIEQARATLSDLNDEINLVHNSGRDREYVVTSPRSWRLQISNSENSNCEGESCLCICEMNDKECDNFCEEFNFEVSSLQGCNIGERNCIPFWELPFGLHIIKEGDGVLLRNEGDSKVDLTTSNILSYTPSGETENIEKLMLNFLGKHQAYLNKEISAVEFTEARNELTVDLNDYFGRNEFSDKLGVNQENLFWFVTILPENHGFFKSQNYLDDGEIGKSEITFSDGIHKILILIKKGESQGDIIY